MNKLARAEFRKMFYKPSLFIVTAILIFILAFSSTIYKPLQRDDMYENVAGSDITEVYNEFYYGVSASHSKKAFDSWITSAQNYINYYSTSENTVLITLNNYMSSFESNFNAYRQAALGNSGTATLASKKKAFKDTVLNLVEYYENSVKKSSFKYVVASLSVHNSITKLLDEVLIELDADYINDEDKNITKSINDKKYFSKLEDAFTNLIGYYPEEGVIENAQKYIDETKFVQNDSNSKLFLITKQAEQFINRINSTDLVNASSKKNITEVNKFITMYKLQCLKVITIVTDMIDISALSKFNEVQINSFYGLEDVNVYQLKEELARNLYLYDTDTYDFEYSNVLNMTQTANEDINAFDYSYYALRLCAFIIIIYICVLGAGTIASEQANGTLKLLAIRPYKRSKILTAKISAIVSMGLLLLCISAVSTMVIGSVNYGLASLPTLLVFNAATVAVMDISIVYLLYLATLLIQVIFFTIISVAISTIFKSGVGSVAISLMVFFVTMILNTFSSPALAIVPLCHLDLFKYMGASFLSSTSYSLLDTLLAPSVTVGFNFTLSFIMLIATTLVVALVTYIVFNKRDIK